MPSVHVGLRYGCVFLVLTRFWLLVVIGGFRLIYTLEKKRARVSCLKRARRFYGQTDVTGLLLSNEKVQ